MQAIEPVQLSQLLDETFLAHAEHHDTINSTQDRAHELASSASESQLPLIVLADEQTAGRGRGDNRWWTGRGSLAFSLLFDPALWDSPRRAMPERSLLAALALIDTIAPLLNGRPLGLHWPNDVLAADRKLAGILIDVLPDGRHILGIGVNTNNRLREAPADVRQRATSLIDVTGAPVDHTTLLVALLGNLALIFREHAAQPDAVGRRFHEACLQVGAELTIDAAGRQTRGRCLGIAPDGALLLETPASVQRFYSGVLR